ncbi:MAG: hypothetical protein CGW95_14235, partial [Phenylobacterium zucineum]
MPDFGQFYAFRAGALSLISSAPETEVQLGVADSWLVEDGRVRSLDVHFARFKAWVSSIDSATAAQCDDFAVAVKALLPRTGRWFPRIEYHGEAATGERLYLRLREAPEQLRDMVLWTYPEVDPRVAPTVKGPDLSLGMQMRRKAIVHGADEAVLLDADGFILEGALSSIVWWDGTVLCAPADRLPWIDSVTRREVFDIANQMGIETDTRFATPSQLVGCEIWGLSSLQGIRPVVDWIDLDGAVGKATRVEAFQKRLRMLAAA